MTARFSGGGVRRELMRLAFEEWFGITAGEAELLVALNDFAGTPKPWRAISTWINAHRPLSLNAFEVRICGLRKALECEAIDTTPGPSYALTEVGMQECREAVSQMGEVLRGMGRAA